MVALALLKAGAGYSQTAAMSRAGHPLVAALTRRLFAHVFCADVGDVIDSAARAWNGLRRRSGWGWPERI